MASGQWDSYVASNLSKYRHKDKTKKDVLMVFKTFRDLRPKMDTYTFNDGTRRELMAIEGTIPVFYKGNTYNIPITIWLMDTHPDNPPLCFVKPTTDMLIKPSKYVDANGRIYLPYLHDWKYPSSDLIGLIQVMSAVFGETSPVFSGSSIDRKKNGPSLPSPTMPTHAPYPGTGYSSPFPSERGVSDVNETERLRREVTELRGRLRDMELKLEERSTKPDDDEKPPTSDGNGHKVCEVCKRPNEIEFECGHGSCKRCGDLLDYCPICKAQINMVTIINNI